ncbi:MAG: DNA-binding protein [Desulfobacterales bacterium]|nr:DNA-binding protein [Desulfobacterales bacterium]
MQYTEAKSGRIFIIRLEHGEVVHEKIERFAREKNIASAALVAVGGADAGSKLVVGPKDGGARPIDPMMHVLSNVHEIAGTGTIFTDEDGAPLLHMHMACGRDKDAVAGCIRSGVKVWQIMEVIVFELVDAGAGRAVDPDLGFKLLEIRK